MEAAPATQSAHGSPDEAARFSQHVAGRTQRKASQPACAAHSSQHPAAEEAPRFGVMSSPSMRMPGWSLMEQLPAVAPACDTAAAKSAKKGSMSGGGSRDGRSCGRWLCRPSVCCLPAQLDSLPPR